MRQICKETCSDRRWENRRVIDEGRCERLRQVDQAVFFFVLFFYDSLRTLDLRFLL